MYEMDFEEYLWARDEKQLSQLIRESFQKRRTCPFHQVALDLFYEYLTIGGLPEVVLAFLNGVNEAKINSIKQKTIVLYII